jgi:hypothetical protein
VFIYLFLSCLVFILPNWDVSDLLLSVGSQTEGKELGERDELQAAGFQPFNPWKRKQKSRR